MGLNTKGQGVNDVACEVIDCLSYKCKRLRKRGKGFSKSRGEGALFMRSARWPECHTSGEGLGLFCVPVPLTPDRHWWAANFGLPHPLPLACFAPVAGWHTKSRRARLSGWPAALGCAVSTHTLPLVRRATHNAAEGVVGRGPVKTCRAIMRCHRKRIPTGVWGSTRAAPPCLAFPRHGRPHDLARPPESSGVSFA